MGASHQADGAASLAGANETLFDPNALDHIDTLPVDAKQALMKRLFNVFQESTDKLIAQMSAGVLSGDSAGIQIAAHTLKSSAGQVGARALSQLAAEIERQAADGVCNRESIASAEECYPETLRAIATWQAR